MARDGTPTGGRPPGSRDKRTQAAMNRLKALDYDGLDVLVEIHHKAAADDDWPTVVDVAKTLLKYQYPQLRAVQVTTEGVVPLIQVLTGVPPEGPDTLT